MEEFIARLLDLQDIDRSIDRLKADMVSIPAEVEIHRKDMNDQKEKFSAFEQTLSAVREEQKKLAAQRIDGLSRIADYKSRLLTLKTNEEYSAMLKQIAYTEQTIDQIDDRTLEAMYEEDEALQSLKRAETERDRALSRSEAREQNLKEKLVQFEKELEALLLKREEAAVKVDLKQLRRYEKVRATGHREAVTGITHGSCGGCLTKIPAQSAGEIKGGATFSCPICGSFVVWTADSSL
jgi:predicted  nucleic acid-binding Zn-ribbon protein